MTVNRGYVGDRRRDSSKGYRLGVCAKCGKRGMGQGKIVVVDCRAVWMRSCRYCTNVTTETP